MRKMSIPGVSYISERSPTVVAIDPKLWLDSWEKSDKVVSRLQSTRLFPEKNQPGPHQEKAPGQ